MTQGATAGDWLLKSHESPESAHTLNLDTTVTVPRYGYEI